MRILVLDDEQYRLDVLATRFPGQAVLTRTAPEAIEALRQSPRFTVATLDHDLGDGHGNGRDVADFIASMPKERRPGYVVVHSFNAPAARLMVQTLKAAGIPSRHEPFTCGPIIGGAA